MVVYERLYNHTNIFNDHSVEYIIEKKTKMKTN